MRALLLADSLGNGGLERQLSLLAANFPPEWERLVWAMGGGEFESHLCERGVDVVVRERGGRMDPWPATDLWRVMSDWRPDVVHAWSWMAALAAAPACRALRVPLVNGMIRSGELERDHTRLKKAGLAAATLVVANTQAGLHAWRVSPAKGRVVYNGFDESRLQAAATLCAEEGGLTVVMTGRMTPVKHYDLVIDVARRLSDEQDGWRFVLVGDGPDRARLQHQAADLTARGVVLFPEPGMEVMGIVRCADTGILMTDPRFAREGLSNSIMEYMALGLPVVCGDGGGNPELVTDNVTGFVVPQADPASLASKLSFLRSHPAERAKMGAAGRARILTRFSVETMVDETLAVYAEAAALTRGRRRRPSRPSPRGTAGSTPGS